MKTYLVGGAIRDMLLDRPVKERDYVVIGATTEEMLSKGFIQVGREFPVFLHPDTKEEYALARTEKKHRPGHQGFIVYSSPEVTLEQDLERRDLTINAMAQDSAGHLIDPYGGQHDLEQRILRNVSAAFAEDPVRILRIARFAARYADLYFRVAEETLELMRRMVASGEVDTLVPERVWQELVKALGETCPSPFFLVLEQCGALHRLFPEIRVSADTWAVLEKASQLSPDTEVRFSALINAPTVSEEFSHATSSQQRQQPVDTLCERLKAPRRFRDLARLVARYHDQVEKALELSAAAILHLLLATDALRRPERFGQFILACEAICPNRQAANKQVWPAAELLRNALDAVCSIDIGSLLPAQPEDPLAVQESIRLHRIQAIEQRLART